MTRDRSAPTDLNGCVKLLIEHLRASGRTHWSHTMFSLGRDREYWYSEYRFTILDFMWRFLSLNIDWFVKGMCVSERIALWGFFNTWEIQVKMLHKLVDANLIMTKATGVRYPWLMNLTTDWFVWDAGDRQNVSLFQSIGASGWTAQFHYE